jgi:hypothetical protein
MRLTGGQSNARNQAADFLTKDNEGERLRLKLEFEGVKNGIF